MAKGFSLGGMDFWIGLLIGYFGHGIISWIIGMIQNLIGGVVGGVSNAIS
jgi:hypothetical protein